MLTLAEQRETTLATLVSWLNWEGECVAGTLIGIADYAWELHLIEDEMGLPHTDIVSLVKWLPGGQPQGKIGPSPIDLALRGTNSMLMMITPKYSDMVTEPVFAHANEAYAFYTQCKAVLRLHARSVSMPLGELDGRQSVLDNQMWEAMSRLQDAANEQDGYSHDVEQVNLPAGVTVNGRPVYEMEL